MISQDFFYTTEPIWKTVTKEELNKFIESYPRKLEVDVCCITEPPRLTFNDFELANRWPYSVVAGYFCWDDKPDDYYYKAPEERTYTIMENYEEVFNSKTGNKAGA